MPVRIGILGAAKIAPSAIIEPAHAHPATVMAAIAARSPARAKQFADRYDIPQVHASYADLIDDPSITAIYNPLPNSLHAEWTIRALRAAKHVLCEKPLASNAIEAQAMADAAAESGCIMMEAFHYRYHPIIARALDIIASGELGEIVHLSATMCIPVYRWWDIRWQYELAGGATMDVGCYTIHLLRTLAREEPEVIRATAKFARPRVDRVMQASLRFPSGINATLHCSMWSHRLLQLEGHVVGTRGELHIVNPFVPQLFNRLTLTTRDGKIQERATRRPTYAYQLDAFVHAIQSGQSPITDAPEAVANMRVIDAVYRAAGMEPRGT